MLWAILGSVAAHHGESADPALLEWIKDRLDQLLGLGPWAVVTLLGLVILAMPLSAVLVYVFQKRRLGADGRQPGEDGY